MNITQSSDKNQFNQIEVWANPEQKEQFDKNLQEFKDKYEQKLRNILPEKLVWKISGSFELSWNIDNQIESLKNDWLSDESIDLIKKYLKENKNISKEQIDQLNKEIENFSDRKNLDLRLWDLIWKLTRISEETENDDLFNKLIEARKIQQSWTINEKSKILVELEKITWTWEKEQNIKDNENKNKDENKQTLVEVWVENADIWNDKTILEEWVLTWDLFSKDSEPESNDYWNILVENNENIIEKWVDLFKMESKDWESKENYSETNWQYFSILDNLFKSWDISDTQMNSINKELSWKSNQDQKNIFKNFIEKLDNSENKMNILKNFDENKENITEENFDKSEFSNDSKWIIDLDKSVWGLEFMLAENYIYIWNKENWQDKNKEQGINSSIEITKNKIINGKSNDFRSNNSKLIWEISSEENLNIKYQKLKELYKEWLKEDAKVWWTKWKEEMERKKYDLIEKYKEVMEKIKKSEENWNKQEIERLNKEKIEIEQEAKQVQNLIEELDKITKETDLDIWKTSESQQNKKE